MAENMNQAYHRARKGEREIDRLRRMARYRALDKDKEVQRQWKDYRKRTKGVSQFDKYGWYDVMQKNRKVKIKEPMVGELWQL